MTSAPATTVPFEELIAHPERLGETVAGSDSGVVLTSGGTEAGVLLSPERYRELYKAWEREEDRAALAAGIVDMKAGRTCSLDEAVAYVEESIRVHYAD